MLPLVPYAAKVKALTRRDMSNPKASLLLRLNATRDFDFSQRTAEGGHAKLAS
jgi:hypothetical protein